MSKSSDVSTGIKAMVTDENGEISCSVDETNRIRALLGLRPLNNEKGSNEREAVQNFHANRDKDPPRHQAPNYHTRVLVGYLGRIAGLPAPGLLIGDSNPTFLVHTSQNIVT